MRRGLPEEGANGHLTINGSLSGAGSLTYSGAGILTLGTANTYGGGTAIQRLKRGQINFRFGQTF